ncbi:MAG: DUF1569 domain-containing protein [Flavobacteriales bacterium]
MKNVYDPSVNQEIKDRVNAIDANTTPQWGKMNAAQMIAHCNVAYEMCYEDNHKKPNGFMKFIMKIMIKPIVIGDKPFKKNSRTAPQFLVEDERVFETEKSRLFAYLDKTTELGASHFEGKESHSFGALTADEWNVMFYKHLNHHLEQFGV